MNRQNQTLKIIIIVLGILSAMVWILVYTGIQK